MGRSLCFRFSLGFRAAGLGGFVSIEGSIATISTPQPVAPDASWNVIAPATQESIGNAETYGDRSFSIKVPVHDHISEVNRVWRFHLKSNLWEGRELFTTLEKTPEKKAKYNTLGKIKNMLKT